MTGQAKERQTQKAKVERVNSQLAQGFGPEAVREVAAYLDLAAKGIKPVHGLSPEARLLARHVADIWAKEGRS